MTETSKQKPDALGCANNLESRGYEAEAAELRRLHLAHNRQARRLQQKEQQIRDLQGSRDFHREKAAYLQTELLEALKVAVEDMEALQQDLDEFIAYAGGTGGFGAYHENIAKVYAAIAKVTK